MVNFMALLKQCKKCGDKYMPAHQSSKCPHERLAGKTPMLTDEKWQTLFTQAELDHLRTVIEDVITKLKELAEGCNEV